jgi:hypothetical protein
MNERIVLFCNSSDACRQAQELLIKSGVPFVDQGPIYEVSVPSIRYGLWQFTGLEGITHFVEKWKRKELPPRRDHK